MDVVGAGGVGAGESGAGDVVEGIESKTGGDEGLAGQSRVLPCRRQYVPPSDISPPLVPGLGAETLLEVIDFRTLADRPVGPKENFVIRVDFSTEEVHKARYMEPRFQPRSKYKI